MNTSNKHIVEYDGRQDSCPVPLITTKLMLRKLQSDERLRVWLKDGGSKSDIPGWLTRQGIEFTANNYPNRDLELIINKR